MTEPLTTLFIPVRWLDVADILLVAFLLYLLYNLVKGTVAINIFAGILAVVLLWTITEAAQMKLLSKILGEFIGVGVIALLIVFQQELRRFLLLIGTRGFYRKNYLIRQLLPWMRGKTAKTDLPVPVIVDACRNMANNRTGAIIALTKRSELKFYVNTGEYINARVTVALIESIFFKNSPLHDGAIIVSGNRLQAARCVLPVTESTGFPSHLGMRHRAAVGITEQSDAIAVVVSEQTGDISYAEDGMIRTGVSAEELGNLLKESFR